MERQELWCHGCNRHVQFTMDMGFDGNHRVICPSCGHWHYRVVVDGKITSDRYDPFWENALTMGMNVTSGTAGEMFTAASSSDCNYLAGAWYNTSSGA